MNSFCDQSQMLPRVLIVSRRTIRKNKFVDFVGEYHLDLIVAYGGVPIIVPRVSGVHSLLRGYEPIHGVLLCEGEDIDPSLYDGETSSSLSPEELEEVRLLHPGDASVDHEKDFIELSLAELCLERGTPILGICRGAQILNVACGGLLFRDVDKELPETGKHVDYENYDGHRHPVWLVENTPLYSWFGGSPEISVNSYHHQGVKRLAERFVAMGVAREGLVEGFYDPNSYCPEEGKFTVGLQFHPERMRRPGTDEFEYPGCPAAYQEFMNAVIAYKKKVNNSKKTVDRRKLNKAMEKKRNKIVPSLSIAN
ncbi:putative glutamine amidotransferase GAT1_2.1 [Zingiber officinale]|uniref:Uncharacterized protein n=1 Tax=Zingiber officinale TaxID=94328 RepID=A0A8J5KS74_ZINOF|nr:putative glutamine amidotransferase GAT1_2.1 [Zingiber officinale]KAG6490397.1 hypothetical protein ZIOFF_051693 [Zingiber officinale]